MSVEEMAKRYSKKWGVSEEEAEEKIKRFLEEKPKKRRKGGGMPSEVDLFPEPIGPLSEKIQDINQATLSTAFTRKSLREMSQPPKEMEDLKGRMETIEDLVNTTMNFVNTTMKEMQGTLEAKQEDERRKQLLEELKENVIKPLQEDLEEVKKSLSREEPPKPEESISTIKETLDKAEEDARAVFTGLGIPVPEKGKVSVTPVPEKDEDLVEELKGRGYRVEYDRIPREEAARMAEEARKKVEEDLLEDRRIQAVENIFRDVVNRIFDMITEPLQRYMESSIERRATEGGGGAPSERKEQSASPGS